ncbi:hypothetical protein [Rhodopseudomonas sp. B29]|uniref:hypothetical protein n=1 Tax=Rhodopseudomonas sp. B29 TaxID=95607 RepID=UPI00034615EB|nr:hypothetical protein [Rhodopseudomonas sp. B29]
MIAGTLRGALNRLIITAEAIIRRPDLAAVMLSDLAEIEADFAEAGTPRGAADLLLRTLKQIAGEPLATGSTVLRLTFIAQQAAAIARDDLFSLVRGANEYHRT